MRVKRITQCKMEEAVRIFREAEQITMLDAWIHLPDEYRRAYWPQCSHALKVKILQGLHILRDRSLGIKRSFEPAIKWYQITD